MIVENFLCCFKLECGGVFIAITGLITCIAGLSIYPLIAALPILYPEEICINSIYESIFMTEKFPDECSVYFTFPVQVYLAITFPVNFYGIYAHFHLFRGIQNMDSSHLDSSAKFYLILIIVKLLSIILWSLGTIALETFNLVPIILFLTFWLFFDVYYFIIIDSIRYKIYNSPVYTVTYTPKL
ncbi:hypothetical protein PVAND_017097 [Polypedilum vanderplanki]|uniref:Uncharacterized protein n=1 Tax=Polypedilum vanderplanki TaxID=319348 RepID=A0A9J6BH94_POLVA|nr:hypothetical protein PVAND_017097 [Polypedilum vanderplanki]